MGRDLKDEVDQLNSKSLEHGTSQDKRPLSHTREEVAKLLLMSARAYLAHWGTELDEHRAPRGHKGL